MREIDEKILKRFKRYEDETNQDVFIRALRFSMDKLGNLCRIGKKEFEILAGSGYCEPVKCEIDTLAEIKPEHLPLVLSLKIEKFMKREGLMWSSAIDKLAEIALESKQQTRRIKMNEKDGNNPVLVTQERDASSTHAGYDDGKVSIDPGGDEASPLPVRDDLAHDETTRDGTKSLLRKLAPYLLGALSALVAYFASGCSSLVPKSKSQSMEIYALGLPAIAVITQSTQAADNSGEDKNEAMQSNPVNVETGF